MKNRDSADYRNGLEIAIIGVAGRFPGAENSELVGVHDNFFDLGGHFLLANRVISRIRQSCAVDLSLSAFFEGPTVEQVAASIGAVRSIVREARNSAVSDSARQRGEL